MDVFGSEGTVAQNGATESSVYLRIVHAPRVLRARTFEQLRSTLSNGHVYALLGLFEETLGVPYREKDPSDWGRFRALVATLSAVVDVLNCQIEVLQVRYQRNMRRLANWDRLRDFMIGAGHSSDPLLPGVMLYLQQALQNAQSVYKIDEPGPDSLRDIVEMHLPPVPIRYFADQTFHAFVSYKTHKYAREAEFLCKRLAEQGLRCWLDREQIRLRAGELLEKLELQAILKAALRASVIAVFFETTAEATADEDERGRQLAFNWQNFEHRHANRLMYVHPPGRVISLPGTRSSQPYVDEQDLSRKVAALVKASGDTPSRSHA